VPDHCTSYRPGDKKIISPEKIAGGREDEHEVGKRGGGTHHVNRTFFHGERDRVRYRKSGGNYVKRGEKGEIKRLY